MNKPELNIKERQLLNRIGISLTEQCLEFDGNQIQFEELTEISLHKSPYKTYSLKSVLGFILRRNSIAPPQSPSQPYTVLVKLKGDKRYSAEITDFDLISVKHALAKLNAFFSS